MYQSFLCRYPRIATKLHRPYIFRSSSVQERLDTLIFHYTWYKKVFSPQRQQSLLMDEPLELACLSGKDAKNYQFILSHNFHFDREGELSLEMMADDKRLAIISFSFYVTPDGVALLIGGLQGLEKNEDYACIKDATKSCYGIFPKKLAFECLMEFAHSLNINKVYAVGNEEHVFRYKKEIFADYDKFWLEVGALKTGKFYAVQFPIFHKSLEQIESKKRSEYKKRQLLLEDMRRQIQNVKV